MAGLVTALRGLWSADEQTQQSALQNVLLATLQRLLLLVLSTLSFIQVSGGVLRPGCLPTRLLAVLSAAAAHCEGGLNSVPLAAGRPAGPAADVGSLPAAAAVCLPPQARRHPAAGAAAAAAQRQLV